MPSGSRVASGPAFEFAGTPSPRPLQGWGFGAPPICDGEILTCANSRSSGMGSFAFKLAAFDVTADGALGHGSRVVQILALRHKSREGGDRHRVAAVFVRLEKSGVFALHAPTAFHLTILDRNPNHALSF